MRQSVGVSSTKHAARVSRISQIHYFDVSAALGLEKESSSATTSHRHSVHARRGKTPIIAPMGTAGDTEQKRGNLVGSGRGVSDWEEHHATDRPTDRQRSGNEAANGGALSDAAAEYSGPPDVTSVAAAVDGVNDCAASRWRRRRRNGAVGNRRPPKK